MLQSDACQFIVAISDFLPAATFSKRAPKTQIYEDRKEDIITSGTYRQIQAVEAKSKRRWG